MRAVDASRAVRARTKPARARRGVLRQPRGPGDRVRHRARGRVRGAERREPGAAVHGGRFRAPRDVRGGGVQRRAPGGAAHRRHGTHAVRRRRGGTAKVRWRPERRSRGVRGERGDRGGVHRIVGRAHEDERARGVRKVRPGHSRANARARVGATEREEFSDVSVRAGANG